MSYENFFLFSADQLFSIITIIVISLLLYYFIYRSYVESFLDPLFLIFLFCSFATAVVIFLYIQKQIRSYYFNRFIITEVAFIIGFRVFKPIRFEELRINQNGTGCTISVSEKSFLNVLFYISSILFIILQILTYYVKGIPILMESRLNTYAGGGGFGIIGRIIEVCKHLTIFLMFYKLFYNKTRILDSIYIYFILIITIVILLLSGSKTNLLFIVYYIFFLRIYFLRFNNKECIDINNKLIKYSNRIFIISIVFSFLVIYIIFIFVYHATSDINPMIVLLRRFLAAGDTFFQAFPNDVIEIIDNSNPFFSLFKDPLGTLRLISWEDVPKDIGRELQLHFYPDSPVSGPNPRYNLFAILFFNLFGQILYSFTIGFLLSFLRNKLFYMLKRNYIHSLFYACIGINLIYLPQDQTYFVGRIFNLVLFLPFLMAAAYIISSSFYTVKNNPES